MNFSAHSIFADDTIWFYFSENIKNLLMNWRISMNSLYTISCPIISQCEKKLCDLSFANLT